MGIWNLRATRSRSQWHPIWPPSSDTSKTEISGLWRNSVKKWSCPCRICAAEFTSGRLTVSSAKLPTIVSELTIMDPLLWDRKYNVSSFMQSVQHVLHFYTFLLKVLLENLSKVEEEEEDDEEEENEKKTEDEGLQMYWSYVVGMLTNLEALPVERIHQMLKMFTLQSSSGDECNLQQLKMFLDSKVKQQLLTFASGMYRLPKT